MLTVVYSALAVWMLGLAVPVTASYIIAAVMVAPALVQAGVPDVAAHMFIFYYAVLSEVSPPTALSPFAAAALTGGNPFTTMMLTWKYTLPAFLVPFVFTLHARGQRHAAARIAWPTWWPRPSRAAAGIAAVGRAFGRLDSRTRSRRRADAVLASPGCSFCYGRLPGRPVRDSAFWHVVLILHFMRHRGRSHSGSATRKLYSRTELANGR